MFVEINLLEFICSNEVLVFYFFMLLLVSSTCKYIYYLKTIFIYPTEHMYIFDLTQTFKKYCIIYFISNIFINSMTEPRCL